MTSTSTAQHKRALAFLAACGILWSTGGLLIKYVDWHPMAIWSARSTVAAGLLWVARRPGLRGIRRGEWAAAIALAATTGLFIVSNKLTTAANAILIQYSAPVWIALLGSWFLGERATRLDWITIVLVIGGITLFFFEDLTTDHMLGNLTALGAGVAFAFSAMTLRKVALADTAEAPIDPLRPMFLGNLVAAVVGAPFMLLHAPPDAHGLGALLALGLAQQGVPYLLYARAIRHATALEAMLIPIVEPILSPLWVLLALGERPGPWALLGGAIVIGSVIFRAVVARRTA